MKKRYKHINFEKTDDIWGCRNNKTGTVLATVEYYAPWKRWVLMPERVVFDTSCLQDIIHFIGQL